MQIEKINENQIEVILDLNDLKLNNISIHSFMCNSFENQSLFIDILNYANKKIGFNSKKHELFVEAFCVPNKRIFVLLITRAHKIPNLHISRTKYGTLKFKKSLLTVLCEIPVLFANSS